MPCAPSAGNRPQLSPDGVAGLWSLHTALFGFDQVFLATALLGLTGWLLWLISIIGYGVLPIRRPPTDETPVSRRA